MAVEVRLTERQLLSSATQALSEEVNYGNRLERRINELVYELIDSQAKNSRLEAELAELRARLEDQTGL